MSNNHLIIGLGGTGGKVIREFRKLYARETQVKDDVLYEFLYADTNDEFMRHDDQAWKVLGKSVQLDQGQQLFIDRANLAAVVENPTGYPQIEPWLKPVGPIQHLIEVDKTASGQRRKFGRFLFANHARDFMSKVNDRVTVLRKNRGSALKVHVVCGLAGGTGSGSVVDVVAQIRKHYPDANQVRIMVYTVLPEAIPKESWAGSGNYHANGYAALKELNALAVGSYLPYDLTGTGGRRVERTGIFFNGCYVLTNENVGGYTVDTDKELPGIIAEYLFAKTQVTDWEDLDKAENSENGAFDNEPSVGDADVKQRSPRFLSFGIRRMVVPNEEIEEYFCYQFAESAVKQAVFNYFEENLGYSDEARPADFGAEVRKPDTLQKWLLSDEHLSLSVGILPDDANNTRWKRILDFWAAAVSAQVNDIQSSKSDKARWFSELKVRTEKIFDEGYRGLGGVKKFYEIKLKARAEMARWIRLTVERDLFSDWKNGQRSTSEIDRLLTALISTLEERLYQMDGRVEANTKATQHHQQKITEVERRLGDMGVFGKLIGKPGDYFVEGAASVQEALVCRTNEEGLKFARKLLEETIQQIIDLKGNVGQFQAKLLEVAKHFREEAQSRLKQNPVDYKQKIFKVEDVVDLGKQMLQSEDIQKLQAQAARLALIQNVGEQRAGFTVFQEKLGIVDIKSIIEAVSQAEVKKAHENLAVSRKRMLEVNIVQKIREEKEGKEDELARFVRETINKAGVFVKFDNAQVSLGGPGTVSDRIGKVGRTAGVLLPECEEAGPFRTKLAGLFEQNKQGATFNVLGVGARENELTVLSITNLFTLRCIEPLAMLRTSYEQRREASEEVRTLMHSEGDGAQFPPLEIPTMSKVRSAMLPWVFLAKAMGLIEERPDRNTGRPTTIYVYEQDGLPNEAQLGNGDFFNAVEDMNLRTLSMIELDVDSRVKAAEHAQRLAWFDSAKDLVKGIYESRGRNASDEFYRRYLALVQTDVKKLLELN
ncbi:MAG: hypothetical protein LCH89_09350 [Proteobacteria bacterium]|nr:hypothetical protein [Pseudomonadota bacterium]